MNILAPLCAQCARPALLLLASLAFFALPVAPSEAQPPLRTDLPAARELLDSVIFALPDIPLRITGDLKARGRDGEPDVRRSVEMLLDWQAEPPTARYTLRDAFGTADQHLAITWPALHQPEYHFFEGRPLQAAPLPDLVSPIPGIDFSWMDLSLSFLWWPDAVTKGREEVKGRKCWVVDIAAPDAFSGCSGVRLWIDPHINIMLKAETYDAENNPIRRMDVKSFKKINGRWVIKDIEITSLPAKTKTVLRVRNVEDRTRKNYLREDGAQSEDASQDDLSEDAEEEPMGEEVEGVTPTPVIPEAAIESPASTPQPTADEPVTETP
ncbi:MAG: outer membrane lipoprotein-sorting protein [Kiritimatiellae bacterium]|nr:outer membrane lipoprotein-sorting protein [Kiritimatiellia bacterium]